MEYHVQIINRLLLRCSDFENYISKFNNKNETYFAKVIDADEEPRVDVLKKRHAVDLMYYTNCLNTNTEVRCIQVDLKDIEWRLSYAKDTLNRWSRKGISKNSEIDRMRVEILTYVTEASLKWKNEKPYTALRYLYKALSLEKHALITAIHELQSFRKKEQAAFETFVDLMENRESSIQRKINSYNKKIEAQEKHKQNDASRLSADIYSSNKILKSNFGNKNKQEIQQINETAFYPSDSRTSNGKRSANGMSRGTTAWFGGEISSGGTNSLHNENNDIAHASFKGGKMQNIETMPEESQGTSSLLKDTTLFVSENHTSKLLHPLVDFEGLIDGFVNSQNSSKESSISKSHPLTQNSYPEFQSLQKSIGASGVDHHHLPETMLHNIQLGMNSFSSNNDNFKEEQPTNAALPSMLQSNAIENHEAQDYDDNFDGLSNFDGVGSDLLNMFDDVENQREVTHEDKFIAMNNNEISRHRSQLRPLLNQSDESMFPLPPLLYSDKAYNEKNEANSNINNVDQISSSFIPSVLNNIMDDDQFSGQFNSNVSKLKQHQSPSISHSVNSSSKQNLVPQDTHQQLPKINQVSISGDASSCQRSSKAPAPSVKSVVSRSNKSGSNGTALLTGRSNQLTEQKINAKLNTHSPPSSAKQSSHKPGDVDIQREKRASFNNWKQEKSQHFDDNKNNLSNNELQTISESSTRKKDQLKLRSDDLPKSNDQDNKISFKTSNPKIESIKPPNTNLPLPDPIKLTRPQTIGLLLSCAQVRLNIAACLAIINRAPEAIHHALGALQILTACFCSTGEEVAECLSVFLPGIAEEAGINLKLSKKQQQSQPINLYNPPVWHGSNPSADLEFHRLDRIHNMNNNTKLGAVSKENLGHSSRRVSMMLQAQHNINLNKENSESYIDLAQELFLFMTRQDQTIFKEVDKVVSSSSKTVPAIKESLKAKIADYFIQQKDIELLNKNKNKKYSTKNNHLDDYNYEDDNNTESNTYNDDLVDLSLPILRRKSSEISKNCNHTVLCNFDDDNFVLENPLHQIKSNNNTNLLAASSNNINFNLRQNRRLSSKAFTAISNTGCQSDNDLLDSMALAGGSSQMQQQQLQINTFPAAMSSNRDAVSSSNAFQEKGKANDLKRTLMGTSLSRSTRAALLSDPTASVPVINGVGGHSSSRKISLLAAHSSTTPVASMRSPTRKPSTLINFNPSRVLDEVDHSPEVIEQIDSLVSSPHLNSRFGRHFPADSATASSFSSPVLMPQRMMSNTSQPNLHLVDNKSAAIKDSRFAHYDEEDEIAEIEAFRSNIENLISFHKSLQPQQQPSIIIPKSNLTHAGAEHGTEALKSYPLSPEWKSMSIDFNISQPPTAFNPINVLNEIGTTSNEIPRNASSVFTTLGNGKDDLINCHQLNDEKLTQNAPNEPVYSNFCDSFHRSEDPFYPEQNQMITSTFGLVDNTSSVQVKHMTSQSNLSNLMQNIQTENFTIEDKNLTEMGNVLYRPPSSIGDVSVDALNSILVDPVAVGESREAIDNDTDMLIIDDSYEDKFDIEQALLSFDFGNDFFEFNDREVNQQHADGITDEFHDQEPITDKMRFDSPAGSKAKEYLPLNRFHSISEDNNFPSVASLSESYVPPNAMDAAVEQEILFSSASSRGHASSSLILKRNSGIDAILAMSGKGTGGVQNFSPSNSIQNNQNLERDAYPTPELKTKKSFSSISSSPSILKHLDIDAHLSESLTLEVELYNDAFPLTYAEGTPNDNKNSIITNQAPSVDLTAIDQTLTLHDPLNRILSEDEKLLPFSPDFPEIPENLINSGTMWIGSDAKDEKLGNEELHRESFGNEEGPVSSSPPTSSNFRFQQSPAEFTSASKVPAIVLVKHDSTSKIPINTIESNANMKPSFTGGEDEEEIAHKMAFDSATSVHFASGLAMLTHMDSLAPILSSVHSSESSSSIYNFENSSKPIPGTIRKIGGGDSSSLYQKDVVGPFDYNEVHSFVENSPLLEGSPPTFFLGGTSEVRSNVARNEFVVSSHISEREFNNLPNNVEENDGYKSFQGSLNELNYSNCGPIHFPPLPFISEVEKSDLASLLLSSINAYASCCEILGDTFGAVRLYLAAVQLGFIFNLDAATLAVNVSLTSTPPENFPNSFPFNLSSRFAHPVIRSCMERAEAISYRSQTDAAALLRKPPRLPPGPNVLPQSISDVTTQLTFRDVKNIYLEVFARAECLKTQSFPEINTMYSRGNKVNLNPPSDLKSCGPKLLPLRSLQCFCWSKEPFTDKEIEIKTEGEREVEEATAFSSLAPRNDGTVVDRETTEEDYMMFEGTASWQIHDCVSLSILEEDEERERLKEILEDGILFEVDSDSQSNGKSKNIKSLSSSTSSSPEANYKSRSATEGIYLSSNQVQFYLESQKKDIQLDRLIAAVLSPASSAKRLKEKNSEVRSGFMRSAITGKLLIPPTKEAPVLIDVFDDDPSYSNAIFSLKAKTRLSKSELQRQRPEVMTDLMANHWRRVPITLPPTSSKVLSAIPSKLSKSLGASSSLRVDPNSNSPSKVSRRLQSPKSLSKTSLSERNVGYNNISRSGSPLPARPSQTSFSRHLKPEPPNGNVSSSNVFTNNNTQNLDLKSKLSTPKPIMSTYSQQHRDIESGLTSPNTNALGHSMQSAINTVAGTLGGALSHHQQQLLDDLNAIACEIYLKDHAPILEHPPYLHQAIRKVLNSNNGKGGLSSPPHGGFSGKKDMHNSPKNPNAVRAAGLHLLMPKRSEYLVELRNQVNAMAAVIVRNTDSLNVVRQSFFRNLAKWGLSPSRQFLKKSSLVDGSKSDQKITLRDVIDSPKNRPRSPAAQLLAVSEILSPLKSIPSTANSIVKPSPPGGSGGPNSQNILSKLRQPPVLQLPSGAQLNHLRVFSSILPSSKHLLAPNGRAPSRSSSHIFPASITDDGPLSIPHLQDLKSFMKTDSLAQIRALAPYGHTDAVQSLAAHRMHVVEEAASLHLGSTSNKLRAMSRRAVMVMKLSKNAHLQSFPQRTDGDASDQAAANMGNLGVTGTNLLGQSSASAIDVNYQPFLPSANVSNRFALESGMNNTLNILNNNSNNNNASLLGGRAEHRNSTFSQKKRPAPLGEEVVAISSSLDNNLVTISSNVKDLSLNRLAHSLANPSATSQTLNRALNSAQRPPPISHHPTNSSAPNQKADTVPIAMSLDSSFNSSSHFHPATVYKGVRQTQKTLRMALASEKDISSFTPTPLTELEIYEKKALENGKPSLQLSRMASNSTVAACMDDVSSQLESVVNRYKFRKSLNNTKNSTSNSTMSLRPLTAHGIPQPTYSSSTTSLPRPFSAQVGVNPKVSNLNSPARMHNKNKKGGGVIVVEDASVFHLKKDDDASGLMNLESIAEKKRNEQINNIWGIDHAKCSRINRTIKGETGILRPAAGSPLSLSITSTSNRGDDFSMLPLSRRASPVNGNHVSLNLSKGLFATSSSPPVLLNGGSPFVAFGGDASNNNHLMHSSLNTKSGAKKVNLIPKSSSSSVRASAPSPSRGVSSSSIIADKSLVNVAQPHLQVSFV